MNTQDKYNWFECPLCRTNCPIDELSVDGTSCKWCYEADMRELEATQNEQMLHRYE